MLQEIFESNLEKRAKNIYVPMNGKKLITFVDDMNMPAKVIVDPLESFDMPSFCRMHMDFNPHWN